MASHVTTLTLLFCLTRGLWAFDNNKLFGMSHVVLTVSNLDKSTNFYTNVLGGMLVKKLSTDIDGLWGDRMFYAMFQKEVIDAEAAGESLEYYGVCDIKDSGDKAVSFLLRSYLGKRVSEKDMR